MVRLGELYQELWLYIYFFKENTIMLLALSGRVGDESQTFMLNAVI